MTPNQMKNLRTMLKGIVLVLSSLFLRTMGNGMVSFAALALFAWGLLVFFMGYYEKDE